jgi:hypothetical protein
VKKKGRLARGWGLDFTDPIKWRKSNRWEWRKTPLFLQSRANPLGLGHATIISLHLLLIVFEFDVHILTLRLFTNLKKKEKNNSS